MNCWYPFKMRCFESFFACSAQAMRLWSGTCYLLYENPFSPAIFLGSPFNIRLDVGVLIPTNLIPRGIVSPCIFWVPFLPTLTIQVLFRQTRQCFENFYTNCQLFLQFSCLRGVKESNISIWLWLGDFNAKFMGPLGGWNFGGNKT